ncbi:hypothetical protein BDZ45DRAFT_766228 [Acephala macrosclerotiorum]|nr:hypothetical protein BDZ45DRAFT_766228 [Acephala macrosclerotiorum]
MFLPEGKLDFRYCRPFTRFFNALSSYVRATEVHSDVSRYIPFKPRQARSVQDPFPHLPSSQPLSLEKSRAPNRTNTAQVLRDEPLSADAHLNAPDAQRAAPSGKEGGRSIQSIQGVAGMQDEVSTAAGSAGKQGQRGCSRTGSGPRVAAHVARSRNVLKRTRAQDMGGGVQG